MYFTAYVYDIDKQGSGRTKNTKQNVDLITVSVSINLEELQFTIAIKVFLDLNETLKA